MKRILLLLAVTSVVIYNLPSASASLIVQNYDGINVTYDDITDTYWYWDLSRFSGMTYNVQLDEIATIGVNGLTGTWGFASQSDINSLVNYDIIDIAIAFNTSSVTYATDFQTAEPVWYSMVWKGRFGPTQYQSGISFNDSLEFSLTAYSTAGWHWTGPSYFDIGPDNVNEIIGAWVVLDPQASPVPLPPSLLLMASGLIGLVGFTRKFRR